jgi:hypothetical protein
LIHGVKFSNLFTKLVPLVPLVTKDKYSPSGLKPDDFELYVDDCLAPADATLRNLIAFDCMFKRFSACCRFWYFCPLPRSALLHMPSWKQFMHCSPW